jgi:hypothetical protein
MNTESYISNQQNPSDFAPKKDLNEEKIWEMEQEIELLQEQVKSLKQELADGYDFTKECLQELDYTRKELQWMNQEISNLINSKKLPMDEAEQLASSMIKEKRAINESRAELVGSTQHSPVNLNDFEEIENSSMRSVIDNCKANLRNLKTQAHQIIDRSIQLTAKSKQITDHSYSIQARSREITARLNKERIYRKSLEAAIGSRLP